MNSWPTPVALLLALVLPLVCMSAVRHLPSRRLGLLVAPLPLLALSLLPDGSVQMPGLLLGMGWAVDAVNRPLLLLAGLGWMLAGSHAAVRVTEGQTRFAVFWLLTLAGLGQALLAMEIAGFYAGYLAMTLAAYGLVVHVGTDAARHAGRVYLVMALAGEAMVLAGVLLVVGTQGNAEFGALATQPPSGAAAWLLFTGFAVKFGLVPLHMWLPLAHPVAPVPASAVLSGVLVKVGLLGMMRLLPAGALDGGVFVLALGLATSAYGAIAGLGQTRLKTVLAYSTVSQMGLLAAGFGVLQATGADTAIALLGLFALHHGFNKIALFLAADGAAGASRVRGALFALPAMALLGLPLSSGAVAKATLKTGLASAEWQAMGWALSIGSALTALLLTHAWRLARADRGGRAGPSPIHAAWPLAVAAGATLPWLWAWHSGLPMPGLGDAWDAAWPLLVAGLAWGIWRRAGASRWPIPEGDLLSPMARLAATRMRAAAALLARWSNWQPRPPRMTPLARLARLDPVLLQLPAAGGLMLLLALLIAFAASYLG